jgi:hypothetical protein
LNDSLKLERDFCDLTCARTVEIQVCCIENAAVSGSVPNLVDASHRALGASYVGAMAKAQYPFANGDKI